MHPTTIAAAVFAFNVAPTLSYVYSTQSICTTRLGPNSVNPVKTSSYVLTIPITFTKKATSTPVSTIAAAPVTTTSTVTTTTTSTVLTPTSTVTETDTSTIFSTTVVSTETDTTTTTTTPAAVTIPTVAGFTPLASEVSYSPKKRSESHAEAAVPAIRGRTVHGRTAAQKSLNKCPPVGNPGKFSPAQYPTSVICGALVEQITTSTKTYTASTTVTTTIASVTSTVTTTSTNTITTTSIPATASVTSTTTTTTTTSTTITNTQTSTTTTTSTVVAPASTSYAACASNNVINSANGDNGIMMINYNGDLGVQVSQVAITDPVACCVQCQTTASCVGFAQYPGGPCYIYTYPSSQCDGSQSYGDNFQSDTWVDNGYYIGNGNCGQLTDAGSAD